MSPDAPNVTAVVANYNGATLLPGCLDSLRAQNYGPIEVIVVDAGSKDGSLALLAERYPEARVVVDPENRGLTYAQNLGLRNARAPWVLIMNNDVILDPDCVRALMAAAASAADVSAVAPKILLPRMEGRIDSCGILLHRDLAAVNRGHMEHDVGQYDEPCEVFGSSDAVALLRKDAALASGGYDDAFQFYCEEADLAFRMRLAGWRCLYEPRAVAQHLYSATIGTVSFRKAYFSERNNLWCLLKDMPLRLLPGALIAMACRQAWMAWMVLSSTEGRGADFRRQHGAGDFAPLPGRIAADTLRELPRILEERARVLAPEHRRASDAEVRGWFRRFGVSTRGLYRHLGSLPTAPPT